MGLLETLISWFSGPRRRDPNGTVPTSGTAADAERCCLEGAKHLAEGRLDEAGRAIAQALEYRHNHTQALILQSTVFREQGRLEEAADSLLLAIHFEPDRADAHYLLGVVAAAQKQPGEAERWFRRTLEKDPAYAKAYNFLGTLQLEKGDVEEAVRCFREALAANPELAPAHSNLGSLLITQLDRFDDGAMHIETAYRLAPEAPEVTCNWAMLLQYRGQFREALAQWTELIDSGALADDATARLDRAMIRLLLGEFSVGWDEYEKRFDADRKAARDFGLAKWQGETLTGKSILVYGEQGIGDEIMFASCLPDIIAAADRVVIECSDRLEALFRRSFPAATVHGGKKNDSIHWLSEYAPVDYQVPIGSLPRRFRRERAAFPGQYPYLKADPERVKYWRGRLHGENAGPAIGISWRGGTASTRSTVRSVPPDLLGAFLRKGVLWVSLQHGLDTAPPALPGLRIFPNITQDLDDLAALIGALDLVISVANTNVHLAGALGRPVWVIVSHRPEWRYGASGNSMPWYPSSKLYRRDPNSDWTEVLGRLARELDELVERS